MDVVFITTSSDKLNTVPVVNGQIIALDDTDAYLYDMGGVRRVAAVNTTYAVSSGDNNGQIKITPSSGSAYNVAVKGLAGGAFASIDSTVTSGSANLITSGAVYAAIDNLPEPMIFKGSLGTGGTISNLPPASTSNTGFTYKVITDGTYANQTAKVGDTFISDGTAWIRIPSGDEPDGTVTNVNIQNGGGISVSGSPITSSGTITITNTGVTGVKGNAESSYRTGSVNITPANIGLGNVGNFKAVSTVANQGLTTTEKSNARANIGAGTAAVKDVPSSGNASTSQVVMGNDTRLTNSRPASDVSAWAKASTKPTYAASEVTFNNTGTSMTATDVQAAIVELEAASGGGDDKMDKNNPTGTGSFSLNRKSGTTVGSYSFAEGYNTTASGQRSHAEGNNTTASGNYSHAEGSSTTASGLYSHAEGIHTTASGLYSHAEGSYTTASGSWSHAEGSSTTAQRRSQHTFGEYNVLDTIGSTTTRGGYVEIVGNGTGASARSNARTLDWDGNEVLAGTLTTTDVVRKAKWDGTNTSLATAISSLNSTLSSNLLKSKDVTVTVGSMAYDGYYIGDGDTGLSTSSKLVSVQVIGSSDNHAAFVGSYQQSVQKFRVNCVVPNITVYVRVWYI